MPTFSEWTTVAQWDVTGNTGDTDNLTATHYLHFEEVAGAKKVKIISPARVWAAGVSYLTIGTGMVDPVDQVSGTLSDGRSFTIQRWTHLAKPELRCEITPLPRDPRVPTDPGTWTAQDGSGGSGEG